MYGLPASVHMRVMPMKVGRGHQIPWNWTYDGCELPSGC